MHFPSPACHIARLSPNKNVGKGPKKVEFSEGSGTKDFLEETFNKCISDLELKTEGARIYNEDGAEIRSKQELYFYRIFKTFYPAPSILDTVGRWPIA